MNKPEIFLFDPPDGLIARDLAQQVLQHGFVVFSTSRTHAKELAKSANEFLAEHDVCAIHAAGLGPNFFSFLLDVESRFDFQEIANLVTEFDWCTTAPRDDS